MPRFARLHAPGALVHVIGRFCNRDFRLAGAGERATVLEILPRALARSDWTLHAYALMSSHIHLALVAGDQPPWRLLKPLNISIAQALNRAQGALGPVFAERATTVCMPAERMSALAVYLHNNPVRAGVADHPAESTWSSHRAWIGAEPAPPWLAASHGLALAGLDATREGRRRFDELAAAHALAPRDDALSGRGSDEVRRRTRAVTGLPVELSAPMLTPRPEWHVLHPDPALAGARWNGPLSELVHQVALHAGVAPDAVVSRGRRGDLVRARRLVLLTGTWLLRRELSEVATAVGLSPQGGSQLLRRQTAELLAAAGEIARELRAGRGDEATGLGV